MPLDDRELKQVALAGLRHERRRMDELILRLQRELARNAGEARPKKYRLSAAGRENIVAAAKRRRAQRKANVAQPAASAAPAKIIPASAPETAGS